jgi:sec-independent protein translocase protein TatC
MALDQIDVDKLDGKKGEKEMSFFEHLEQLRWHLLRSALAVVFIAIGVFLAKDFVFNTIVLGPKNADFFTYRAVCWLSQSVGLGDRLCVSPPEIKVTTVEMGEAFLMHMQVSMVLGMVLAAPYILWEFWRFVRPGLLPEEQRYARGFVGISSGLFLLGVAFGYFVLSPFGVSFLGGYQIAGVETQSPRLSSFVSYMTMFTLPIGIVFQMPIITYFLTKIGLVSAQFMRQYRRHAFVVILILAAIITPPDVVTQLLVGFPLYLLYECSIFVAVRVERGHAAKELEEEKGITKKITPN